ncbi:enoyl-CoA hydratase/isomerase family protein [Shimia sp. R11_0]|uniref:enoyl-CoA hydratase-related protein n=1 Tax=Shimia sp. R11_0 TaxID=2821096 RepID=UPI001ADBAA24|nr:enoyl-CoA hydratase-related protein [Shimia sp. R11_0]MBO9476865.1 enoyl-CoA hydratase/isomerase family protein [Shimia sp. R11_0]
MEYQTILYELTDNVATVTLNRPETLNALTQQMRAEITHALGVAGKEARVVVLTGAGKAFCSGQDLGDGSSAANLDLERTLRDEYLPMIRAIRECPVPTICAVNGPAAGAGANLALSADVVIAKESAYFMQAFSRIGLMPDAGGTYELPRSMGAAKAMGAALFADKITARQADDWGMIWEAVADEAYSAQVQARATYLANGPTLAFKEIKRAIHESYGNDWGAQMAQEAKRQGKLGKTRDFKEGVVAFLDKRPAKYEGR